MREAATQVDRSALAKRLEQFTVDSRRHVLGHIRVPHAPRVRNAMVDRLLSFVVEDPTSHLVPDLWHGLTYLLDMPEFTGEQWAALVSGEREEALSVLAESDLQACALLGVAGSYPEMEQRLVLAAGCEQAPLSGLALSMLALLDEDLVGDLERVRADYPDIPVATRTLTELGSMALDEMSQRSADQSETSPHEESDQGVDEVAAYEAANDLVDHRGTSDTAGGSTPGGAEAISESGIGGGGRGDGTGDGPGDPDFSDADGEHLDLLAVEVGELDWEVAADTAQTVLLRLETQEAPDPDLVRELFAFVEQAHSLAGRAARVPGVTPPVPASHDGLKAAVEAGLVARERADASVRRRALWNNVTHQLRGAEADAALADLLSTLLGHVDAVDAAGGPEAEGMGDLARGIVALVSVVENSNKEEPDFARVAEVGSTAQTLLPADVRPLIFAASAGGLRLGPSLFEEEMAAVREAARPVLSMVGHQDDVEHDADTNTTSVQGEIGSADMPSGDASADVIAGDDPVREQLDDADTDSATTPAEDAAGSEAGTDTATEQVLATAAGDDLDELRAMLEATPALAPTAGTAARPRGTIPGAPAASEVDLDLPRTETKPTEDPAPATADVPTEGPDSDTPAASSEEEELAALEAAEAASAQELEQSMRLEAGILATGRFGLASLLHHNDAHAAARRLAAYAQHLGAASGEVASAFNRDLAMVGRDKLGDDRPGQVLAWAAAARTAVIAPGAGAAGLLAELAPCLADQQHLTAVGDALARASLAGAVALPTLGDSPLAAVAEAERAAERAAARALELVDTASNRTIKYTTANGVYQHLMNPDAPLGALLRIVATNNPDLVGKARIQVLAMRGRAEHDIDTTFANIRPNRRDKIVAGARSTLMSRYDDAVQVADDWVAAHTQAGELRAELAGELRSARPLERLRDDLRPVRNRALEELHQIAAAAEAEDTAAGQLLAGAARAAHALLQSTFGLVDGSRFTGAEPPPQWLVNRELLASDLVLDAATLLPPTASIHVDDQSPADLTTAGIVQDAARELAASGEQTVEQVYRHRAARREHDLTAVLLDAYTAIDPAQAAVLRKKRADQVATARVEVARAVEQTTDLVNRRRSDATVSDSEWSSLAHGLRALENTTRTDFAAIMRELEDVAATLDAYAVRARRQAAARLDRKALDNPVIAANRDLLQERLDADDLAGFDHVLVELETQGAPPESDETPADFEQFFPVVPDLLTSHPGLLQGLRGALDDRGAHAPEVNALLAACGGDQVLDIDSQVRHDASRALGQWLGIAENRRSLDQEATRAVTGLIGLEFKNITRRRGEQAGARNRQFYTLAGVRGAGNKALSPALGTRMSPGGSTLSLLTLWGTKVPPSTLLDYVRDEPSDITVLVLACGVTYSPAERRELATLARAHPRPVMVVVDDAVMAYMATRPVRQLETLAWLTLPFTGDCPYADQAGDTPREMFYGRRRELADVMEMSGPSFVSGGRQFGKSALLRTARRQFEETDDGTGRRRAVFREIRTVGADGKADAFWQGLASTLVSNDVFTEQLPGPVTAEAVYHALKRWWQADAERRLLILIDEADNFLSADAQENGFHEIGTCKQIMDDSGHRVKFVFAGLHRVARFESLSNQPLSHLGHPIVVGPLQPRPARMMLTQPLAAIGYEFANAATQTARILAVTNGVPSLLQLFGKHLVAHLGSREVLEGPRTIITDDDIDTVLEDPSLLEQISARYRWTLQLDPRYEVMVNVVALDAHAGNVDHGITLSDLTEECQDYWPSGFATADKDLMRSLATECCDLGLLSFDGARYRMRTPTVLRLLGSLEAVSTTLEEAERSFELPSNLAAASFRPQLSETKARSPLTTRQLGQVFARRPQTLVVAGSNALGVTRVAEAIRGAADDRAMDEHQVKTPSPSPEGLDAAVRMAGPDAIVVVDLHDKKHHTVAAVLAKAEEVVSDGEVPVVLIVDGRTAPVWVASQDRINLTRVDLAGLNPWLDEVTNPFAGLPARTALLEATGGWMWLVRKALDKFGAMDFADDALAAFTSWRDSDDARRDLLELAGLGPDRSKSMVAAALGALAASVADLVGERGGPWEELVELAAMGDEDNSVREMLAAAGFEKTRVFTDGLEALASLAVLERVEGEPAGRWRIEPVVSAALLAENTTGQGRRP